VFISQEKLLFREKSVHRKCAKIKQCSKNLLCNYCAPNKYRPRNIFL